MTTLFAAAVFVGAFLLFQVQLILGKAILPRFGGTPGVWTACLLFFQTALLAGYACAHLLARRLPLRAQAVVHGALLLGACACLPPASSASWPSAAEGDPSLLILDLLIRVVGLPFVVLAATSPLLQSWFGHAFARSPYRLYAVSNAGSLAGLLGYPLLVEPWLSVERQLLAWSVLFVLFCGLALACGLGAGHAAGRRDRTAEEEDARAPAPGALDRLMWVALPFCSSALLLGVTNQLCQDVAPMPFLWVVPLAIYLATFMVCFDREGWYRRIPFFAGLVATAGGLLYVADEGNALALPPALLLYGGGLGLVCMCCHGELARLKPPVGRLTSFYLAIACGGALGGAAVGLAAPRLFSSFAEVPAVLLLTVLLVAALVAREALGRLPAGAPRRNIGRAAWALLAAPALAWLAGVAWLAVAPSPGSYRNFYGVLRVRDWGTAEDGGIRVLHHGATRHGHQSLAPERALEPSCYYGRTSGLGRAVQLLPPDRPWRCGVVGLGVGTFAAYGRAGDTLRFYEINPLVIDAARRDFTFLARTPAHVELVAGDARLTLQAEAPNGYDLLLVDAFSSDAVPLHLMTREAFALYLAHLRPDGVLALHLSNNHLDLSRVALAHARELGLEAAGVHERRDDARDLLTSRYVLLGRGPGFAARVRALHPDDFLAGVEPVARPWTDDYSNPLGVLAW